MSNHKNESVKTTEIGATNELITELIKAQTETISPTTTRKSARINEK